MKTRKLFEHVITKKSDKPNKNGYVLNNSDNLLNGLSLDLFQDDLMQGSGNELKSKFNAVFSSSALGVNNFAIVKQELDKFEFLGESNFTKAQFERQFSTGLGGAPPNLDFTIENDKTIIAFESKYLEPLERTEVKFTESYNKENLNYLDSFWFDLMNKYRNDKLYLDIAQLIKHSIGLINYKKTRPIQKMILVYIYWTPKNYKEYIEYIDHQKELNEFTDALKQQNDIEFISMTYRHFWTENSKTKELKDHFDKVKKRYDLEIK
jgi:hypothetical protein